MGVYPFVVPLRPVPGTLMADAPPPDADYMRPVYRQVSAMRQSGLASRQQGRVRALPGLLGDGGVEKRADGA